MTDKKKCVNHMEGKRSQKSLDNVAQLCRDSVWLETEAAVKTEATSVRDKLHQVRENYRKIVNTPKGLKESNKLLIEWNEGLLAFCKANRRKYHMEDRTLKLDRQRLEDQRIIGQYEDEVEKLRKELKEATEAKEQALNRLSELQSNLLKFGNPDITDLSDQNRPSNLGENFRELYDNEWTDAFEFLTEENGETRREDEEAIDTLYAMLKRCNELCSEALREQHTSLAQLVSNPAYFKKKTVPSLPQSKPAVPLKKTANVTQVTVKSLHEKNPLTQQAQFAKTLPAGSLSTGDQGTGPQGQLDKQGKSTETAGNGNKQPGDLKSGKMSDVYEVEQMTNETKPNAGETDGPVISAKVEVTIKEFSKSVAAEVLKHVAISEILPAISKDKQYLDVLQNSGVQKYLEKCFHLCWLMQTQYPPMLMDFETKPGMAFNTNVFETYTNRGPKIVRVVWPPVYLHKDGPLVCKGYAEGTKQ
ncbi:uncharacterized protein LOC123557689 isoform X2 [Mercenaria mercenaria]|uniref:uncharacterized protein LOC123557689 isoform X2 n=1 Tax=Mercenaria mercenaria TaxID=6596 RepID=UPI00234EA5A0|nr:uncharacterized protein LOC123557689 isoform X2 [Mercenaria mercenaria]